MQLSVNQRLATFFETLNINQKKFAIQLNIEQQSMSNYLNGSTKNIPVSVFETLKREYPNVSSDWLLLGEGSMLVDESIENESVGMVSEPSVSYKKKVVSTLDERRELSYLERIEELKGQIAFLKNQLEKSQNSENQIVK